MCSELLLLLLVAIGGSVYIWWFSRGVFSARGHHFPVPRNRKHTTIASQPVRHYFYAMVLSADSCLKKE